MGLSSKTRLRVRYSETDQMGIVYHANYLFGLKSEDRNFFGN